MSDLNSANREIKKRQMKQRIVSQDASRKDGGGGAGRKGGKRRKGLRLRIFLIIIVILVAAGIGISAYFRYHQYASYSVVWEKKLKEGSFTGYMDFGGNVLKYSKDGASYFDSRGKEVWVQSFQMKSPVACVNGEYAAVADQQGNTIYFFNKSGNIGMATTVSPILRVTISAHGVAAAILDHNTSNTIQFYNRDGSELKITLKTLLEDASGYPVDISLSPDGTQLIGAYAYLNKGTLNGRVSFHNFSSVGQNINTRLVGGFDDPYAGSLVARVHFLDETYSCAFSDNGVSFFSTKNVLSPQLLKFVAVKQEIRSVFYSGQYVGIIADNTEGENPQRMNIYKPDGSLVFTKPFHYPYTHADIDGKLVILYNENSCRIYNMSGRLKFSGTFDFPITKIRQGRFPGTLIVSGPRDMKEIRLQLGG